MKTFTKTHLFMPIISLAVAMSFSGIFSNSYAAVKKAAAGAETSKSSAHKASTTTPSKQETNKLIRQGSKQMVTSMCASSPNISGCKTPKEKKITTKAETQWYKAETKDNSQKAQGIVTKWQQKMQKIESKNAAKGAKKANTGKKTG